MGYEVSLMGAVITTPIACVLGVFSNLFIGRDTEGLSNALYADGNACGTSTITVTILSIIIPQS
jgi:hypothetical protein